MLFLTIPCQFRIFPCNFRNCPFALNVPFSYIICLRLYLTAIDLMLPRLPHVFDATSIVFMLFSSLQAAEEWQTRGAEFIFFLDFAL